LFHANSQIASAVDAVDKPLVSNCRTKRSSKNSLTSWSLALGLRSAISSTTDLTYSTVGSGTFSSILGDLHVIGFAQEIGVAGAQIFAETLKLKARSFFISALASMTAAR
jgi:hypothetical protein